MGPIFAVALQASITAVLSANQPVPPALSTAPITDLASIVQPKEDLVVNVDPTQWVASTDMGAFAPAQAEGAAAAGGTDLAVGFALGSSLFYAGSTYTGAFSHGGGSAQIKVVPEPNTYLVLGGGFGLLALRRRRRA